MKVFSDCKVTLISETTTLKSIDYAVKITADVTMNALKLHLNMPKVHQC